jgi:hypothetical protein
VGIDLNDWLRERCGEYTFDVTAVFHRLGDHDWPVTLTAAGASDLEKQLAETGHLLPLPKEPAALANILEVSLVDFLLRAAERDRDSRRPEAANADIRMSSSPGPASTARSGLSTSRSHGVTTRKPGCAPRAASPSTPETRSSASPTSAASPRRRAFGFAEKVSAGHSWCSICRAAGSAAAAPYGAWRATALACARWWRRASPRPRGADCPAAWRGERGP